MKTLGSQLETKQTMIALPCYHWLPIQDWLQVIRDCLFKWYSSILFVILPWYVENDFLILILWSTFYDFDIIDPLVNYVLTGDLFFDMEIVYS